MVSNPNQDIYCELCNKSLLHIISLFVWIGQILDCLLLENMISHILYSSDYYLVVLYLYYVILSGPSLNPQSISE